MNILMLLFGRMYEGDFDRCSTWAKDLVQRGHSVTIAAVSERHRFGKRYEQYHGVQLLETPNLFDGRWVMRRLSGMYGWGPLDIWVRWRALREGNFDVIHTFEHHMNVAMPVYLIAKARTPVLVCDTCDHYGRGGFREREYSPYRLAWIYDTIGFPIRRMLDWLERDLRLRADGVTVASKYLEERIRGFGKAPAVIRRITGSADIAGVRPVSKTEARRRLGLATDIKILSFFGAGQFDVDIAVDALQVALKRRQDVRLMIIGNRNSAIRRRADLLGIGSNLIQTGWCPQNELETYLGASDIFLLPMRDNPVNRARWPNKVCFYMAAGRPIICASVGDAAALIERARIGLCVGDSPKEMATAILELLAHEGEMEEMGRRARSTAEDLFSPARQGADLETFYKILLKSRRGAGTDCRGPA